MIYRKAEKTGGLEGILGEKIAVKSGICKKKKKIWYLCAVTACGKTKLVMSEIEK